MALDLALYTWHLELESDQMPSDKQTASTLEISIDDLKPGMYVKSISYQDKGFILKSEGYVLSASKVLQLKHAGIKKLLIDPSKQKATEQIDKVMPNITANPLSKLDRMQSANTVTLEDELKKASILYDNAKSIQERILVNIQNDVAIDAGEVRETTDEIVNSIFRNQDALSCLAKIQSKSNYLAEHSLNCSILMAIFAKHLKLDREIIEQLALGAFLKDIGEVLIPDNILNKPTPLTDDEKSIMRSHVALGEKVLEDSAQISHIVMTVVKEHHERLNGTGYPRKLKGDDISKYGKMIAIVDSYDAMVSDRCYKRAVPPVKAFKELVSNSGELFDETLVDSFIHCMGVFPVGTLVQLNSGKIGLISRQDPDKPTTPFVKVFYNAKLNQAIPIEEINLSKSKYKDQIDKCIRPEDFSLNLMGFFKTAFMP